MTITPNALIRLAGELDGEFHSGQLMRRLYSTDASAYQEMPLAVAIPSTENDLRRLIAFANEHSIGLIPRTAGTSLAGQVVGSGIVVDVSRKFSSILEINAENRWVRVQPGVIRNELNMALESSGMLFGPETSTQNRAMMGGMLGNNSCGSNSIKYGSVREHVIEVTALLSDGSKVVFGDLNADQFAAKCEGGDSLERQLYRDIRDQLTNPQARQEIAREFPKPNIPRRNTGYALDLLMDAQSIDPASDKPFHFGKLIAGSEGTLCFVTEMKLHCNPLPPPINGLQCAHFNDVDEALRATQIAVRYDCFACELIDKYVLEGTKRSLEHRENRFFIQGDPGAILVTEIRGDSEADVLEVTAKIEADLRAANLGTSYPVLFGSDTVKIWNLRKAGLGLLGNVPGDAKPTPVIEDTAVDVDELPEYIAEFNQILHEKFQLECAHYAHAGTGEIHLRPILNLKTVEGNQEFRDVAKTIADLVKKYRGSLSGEHGDGRLRGEFLKQMIGPKNYELVRAVKNSWDPKNIFNPNKIVDTPPMNNQLRYTPGQEIKPIDTVFDWSSTVSVLGAAEMCTGSGDCRKTHLTGGVMCPSYMATRNEKDTTRARANMLRHAITHPVNEANPFDNEDLKEVLDLCLSCKGCKKECPSTVDMAKLKAEFQQHYYDANGIPLRSKLIAQFASAQRVTSWAPWLFNGLFGIQFTRRILNRIVGFHPDRTIPRLSKRTFRSWFRRHEPHANAGQVGKLFLLCDEFTNFNDVPIGIKTVELLEQLGYQIEIPNIQQSGRTWLSKGFLREAKKILNCNTNELRNLVSKETPIVGIEPSAILTLRDEAIDLSDRELIADAKLIADNAFSLSEFIKREFDAGRIRSESFTSSAVKVKLHGHCFQKAIGGVDETAAALSIPSNYQVETIPSGCCGMAGSFGYEKEHYEVSMQIGNLVLFPAIRSASRDTLIAAPGTSCRHQIYDGTGERALHPAEILHASLK